MIVKINSYIDIEDISEEEALNKANKMVQSYDLFNDSTSDSNVLTKLYYITPVLGRIMVLVSPKDKEVLNIESNVLMNTLISEFPLIKLPSQVLDYKELNIKKGSVLNPDEIFGVAQSIADKSSLEVLPYKITLVKIIDYNNSEPSNIVMSSLFDNNIFTSADLPETEVKIQNKGDVALGENVIKMQDYTNIDFSVTTKIFNTNNDREFGSEFTVDGNKILAFSKNRILNAYNEDGSLYKNMLDLTNSEYYQKIIVTDNYIYVSIPSYDYEDYNNGGKIFIFDKDYNLIKEFTNNNNLEGSYFGISFYANNDYLFVCTSGFNQKDDKNTRLFKYNIDGTNEELINESEEISYSTEFTIIEDRLYIADVRYNNYQGELHIYNLEDMSFVTFAPQDAEEGDSFGSIIKNNNSRIFLGAHNKDMKKDSAGCIYSYDFNMENEIVVKGYDAEKERFGRYIAVNDKYLVTSPHSTVAYSGFVFDENMNQVQTFSIKKDDNGDRNISKCVAITNNNIYISTQGFYDETEDKYGVISKYGI